LQHGCQVTSYVVAPTPVVVNTNNTLPELGMCLTSPVTATLRNAGLVSVFNAIITETLTTGMSYKSGSTEYVVGTGTTPPASGWMTADDPITAENQLVWDKTKIPSLTQLTPSQTVWVRFVVEAVVTLLVAVKVQAGYEDFCEAYTTSAHEYLVNAVPPLSQWSLEPRILPRWSETTCIWRTRKTCNFASQLKNQRNPGVQHRDQRV
jgi:uncharacterized repeat protein (TIGR01451 family)